MNERIRELLDEAQGSIDPMQQDANVFEKFAELIVVKCAEIADTAEPYKSADLMKQYFGIK